MTREAVLDAMATDALLTEAPEEARTIRLERKRVERSDAVREQAKKHVLSIATFLNTLPADFFSKKTAEREQTLKLDTKTVLGRLFTDFLSHGSYESNMRALIGLAKQFGAVDVVTIQSTTALDHKAKERIDRALEKDGDAIVYFQTRPSLLGGMRVFRKSHMTDKSARGRLTHLLQSL